MIKNIQLCGFGNGLVDLQYEVEKHELSDFGIEHGEMLLVPIEIQEELLKKLSGRKHNKCSGGSAANTLVAFTGFGGRGAYTTVLGNDNYGEFYAEEFKLIGVELHARHLDNFPTGTCVVLITPDSERTMHTCLAATSQFGMIDINETLISRSEWLYLEGYKLSENSSTDAMFEALQIGKKYDSRIALTFSDVFITQFHKSNVEKLTSKCDLIFCNETEACSFTDKNNPEEAFDELTKICPNVAMTLGKNGSKIKWDGKIFNISGFEIKPIDTTGAGDMYAAGFLYGIINNYTPEISGKLASWASSRIVAQLGARLNQDHIKIKNQVIS